MNPKFRHLLTRHINKVEYFRTEALEWLQKLLEKQKASNWIGKESKMSEHLAELVIAYIREVVMPQIIVEANQYRIELTGQKPEKYVLKNNRWKLTEKALKDVASHWLDDFEIKKGRLSGKGTNIFANDFARSKPEIKYSKDLEKMRFNSGMGTIYSPLWKQFASVMKQEITNLSTIISNEVLNA